jgi:formylglycine-generating enzyme required for sulfatase activity
MGEVYLAEHLALQRPVALKILPPNLESSSRVERFLKEARTCSRIEHPNVVIIHDVGEQDGLYYIVMQYVQGKNLAELVEDHGGPLPWRSAARLIELAARGLHAVHSRGLVHRDVKPSNIMLAVDSRVVLMDFGLVREEVDSSLTRSGQVVGTPSFMSPEQCRVGPLDRRSDVYSLGSTLYFLLTGKPPFQGTLEQVVLQVAGGKRPTPVRRLNREVPAELAEIVANAMHPSPENRFPTAPAMARVLKKLLRTAMLDSTTTWRTAEMAAPAMETQPAPRELPQVELLPLETRWESFRAHLPWIGGLAGFLAGLLVLGVLLYLAFNVDAAGPAGPGAPPEAGGKSERGEPEAGKIEPGETRPPPAEPSPPKPNMVWIEPGEVRLGADEAKVREFLRDRVADADLAPIMEMLERETRRTAHLPGFWIDKYEVTNAEYAEFVRETRHSPPEHWIGGFPPPGKEDHPVVSVTYDDAEAYAEWADKKLPSWEQWVRAFRGDQDWLFPWGDEYDGGRANVADNRKYPSTSPIESTPKDVSPFGVYNMVGNASEFIRGMLRSKGRVWRVGKGSEYKMRGYVWGISSAQILYGFDVAEKGLGFRCVVEEAP